MHRTTAFLLSLALWVSIASVLYYVGLWLELPFALTGIVTFVMSLVMMGAVQRSVRNDGPPSLSHRTGRMLLAGIVLLGIACALLSRRYGDWDAALIWNLHARYLTDAEGWQNMYAPFASGNAAYPLGLPSSVAFGWRVIGYFHPVVPFVLALIPTMAIPVVTFLQGARNNWLVGAAVLALFGLHNYYLALGLDQYADIQVAWLLLLVAVCLHQLRDSGSNGYWTIIGALLGALCWMKMEGFLLTGCVLLWHLPDVLKWKALLRLITGALPFVLAWAMFGNSGAPDAPLTAGWLSAIEHLKNGERYKMILSAFLQEAIGVHLPFALLLLGYPSLCRLSRHPLSPMYGVVWTALLGYAGVYLLLVTTDLEWNLRFSLSRLLIHLYPSLVFLTARRATSLSFLQRFKSIHSS